MDIMAEPVVSIREPKTTDGKLELSEEEKGLLKEQAEAFLKFIKEKNETHKMMQETSAPITLNELVPTIVESLGKDYSEFGSSIHDFNDGELRERTVYIRDFDESKPPVPCYDGLRDGKSMLIVSILILAVKPNL